MKKHSLWSFAVFSEAVRRTRISALILFAPIVFFVCMRPLSIMSVQYPSNIPPDIYTASEIIIPANFVAFLAPLFFLSSCFSYLNSKKATDFYHSLPVSRSCYFITNLSAVMMWIISIFTLSFMLSFILYGYVSTVHIVFSELFKAYLACIAISALSASAYMVARSLSGNGFCNTIIMLVILFVPRAVIETFSSLVVNRTWTVNADYIFPLLNPSYNLFIGSFSRKMQILPEYIIYTFVLAILYFVLAFFLYKARKSETAENGTSNSAIRHIIAVAATFTASIPILYNIIYYQNDFFSIIIFVILCIVVFFTIEAAFSKSFKKGFLTLPRLGYVIVLNLILFGCANLTSNIILNMEIDVADVKGVAIKYVSSSDDTVESYANLVQDDNFITDQELIEAAINDYKKSTDIVQHINSFDIQSIDDSSRYNYNEFSFLLKDGSVITRRLYTSPTTKKLYTEALKNPENISSMLKLPENNGDMVFGFEPIGNAYYYANEIWTHQDYDELWQIFHEEYNSLSTDDKIKLISAEGQDQFSMYAYSWYNSRKATICVQGIYDHKAYCSHYLITDLTPKTLKKMYEIIHKYNPKKLPEEDMVLYFSISWNNENLIYEQKDKTITVQKVWEILKNKLSQSLDTNQPVYLFKVGYKESSNLSHDYFVFNLTNDEMNLLKEIVPKNTASDYYEY